MTATTITKAKAAAGYETMTAGQKAAFTKRLAKEAAAKEAAAATRAAKKGAKASKVAA